MAGPRCPVSWASVWTWKVPGSECLQQERSIRSAFGKLALAERRPRCDLRMDGARTMEQQPGARHTTLQKQEAKLIKVSAAGARSVNVFLLCSARITSFQKEASRKVSLRRIIEMQNIIYFTVSMAFNKIYTKCS